jgi:hypothetical protein
MSGEGRVREDVAPRLASTSANWEQSFWETCCQPRSPESWRAEEGDSNCHLLEETKCNFSLDFSARFNTFMSCVSEISP